MGAPCGGVVSDVGWQERAACRGQATADYDPWFPEGKGADTTAAIADAKATCERCPVRVPCLELALVEGHRDGVWGGLSPGQRQKLQRERRASEAA
ncbi:MAG: WhiB family transcriptional regulator [Nitriliruptoraceae bacterium]|nr:WhiB family transcriptional regulator [Nitriliruptoraceae bacterium]